MSLDGLLEARRGDALVGAIFSEIQAGRAAVVWPPRLAVGETAATAGQLLAAALGFLAQGQVRVAHALIEPGSEEDGSTLLAGGFEPLAQLLYLASSGVHFPRSRPSGRLEYEPYRPANHGRLARMVEATYEQTLDCPKLNGVRHVEDILAGYRATGLFDPGRWLLVRHQQEDVGCLLLADHPEEESWELVYMGLVPEARGQGSGKEITRYAQWLTRRAGRRRLVLAVDAANTPAIRVYSAVGFQVCNRRSVYLRIFEPSG